MAHRIESWKSIAAHLHRSVRTVQRWEQEEGLPVHRLQHDKLGSAYAFAEELDAWMAARAPEAPAPRPSLAIAVLPFSDLSAKGDLGYFCLGLADEIRAALHQVRELRVAGCSAPYAALAAGAGPRELGRRLNVGWLVEGTVRCEGPAFRISAHLIDTQTGYALWSGTADYLRDNLFAVQGQIARSVMAALPVESTAGESARMTRPLTASAPAYDAYLRGRRYFYQFGTSDMECAIQLFSTAIAHDATFAAAYAGLADCWCYLYLYSERREELLAMADTASAKAIDLDRASAPAHVSRALVLSLRQQDAAAEAAFAEAERLDAALYETQYYRARHLFVRGRADEALAAYRRAIAIRPDDHQAPLLMAQLYEDAGKLEEARVARQQGIANAERHLELYPDDARALYMAANGMAALGREEPARAWAERALALRPEDSMVLYNAGCIFALLGDGERALRCLRKAVDHGLRQRGWFDHDSNLDPLRGDPRFAEIVAAIDAPTTPGS